jgi:hypothetical protein
MRCWSAAGAVMVASIVLLGGCAEEEASPSDDEDLFHEYVRSTDVENDRFADYGDTPEDRLAQFAANGGPQQVLGMLLSAFPCEDADDQGSGSSAYAGAACELNEGVNGAAQSFAGADAEIYGRSILVKHDDNQLELVTVYVVEGPGSTANALIDANGDTYTDLRDFRESNDVLDASDLILAPRDITAVSGENEVVTVSGHTASSRPWLLPAILVAVALGVLVTGAFALDKRRRRSEAAETNRTPASP